MGRCTRASDINLPTVAWAVYPYSHSGGHALAITSRRSAHNAFRARVISGREATFVTIIWYHLLSPNYVTITIFALSSLPYSRLTVETSR
jgi:hypothetical protein